MAASHSPPPKSTSRRLPPPCWSDDETVALIDVYRDKWYSLRRGNLRAPDWQEVADGVAVRCLTSPAKTSIQCRHKMEKLRKRYRSEIQRIGNNNSKGIRHPSPWIHFKLMESMELGLSVSVNPSIPDDVNDEPDDLIFNPNLRYQRGTEGVRIKIPNFVTLGNNNNNNNNNRLGDDLPPPLNRQFRFKRKEDGNNGNGDGNDNDNDNDNVMDEMVAAIQKLGDGFVKMERMKMDMARELESMRMKTEMEQTEMILETHRKLLDSIRETVMEKKKKKKKVKRMGTSEEV